MTSEAPGVMAVMESGYMFNGNHWILCQNNDNSKKCFSDFLKLVLCCVNLWVNENKIILLLKIKLKKFYFTLHHFKTAIITTSDNIIWMTLHPATPSFVADSHVTILMSSIKCFHYAVPHFLVIMLQWALWSCHLLLLNWRS